MKTVREELAVVLETQNCWCFGGKVCGRCTALARHESEPEDRPKLIALLKAAREFEVEEGETWDAVLKAIRKCDGIKTEDE